ncbi:iron ABC transporter ATP-binding protein [Ignatzschineria sp. LJL83]
MVIVENVSKLFGQKKVVDDVSISIPKNKITSLIGPNGAGKSTLLGMMSRLLTPDTGKVSIEGRSINDWKSDDLAKKISILKQANHINLRITVRELVAFGRFPHSKGRLTVEDQTFIDEAIEYMGLSELQDKYVSELSGGQRQCAFIAMVVAQNTEVIFLDEPLNNLDMKHSVEIMQVLRKLVDEKNKTIVIVIHDINFASCYSDHIISLKNGALMHEGATEKIIDSNILRDIYDMEIPIQMIDDRRICVYFS